MLNRRVECLLAGINSMTSLTASVESSTRRAQQAEVRRVATPRLAFNVSSTLTPVIEAEQSCYLYDCNPAKSVRSWRARHRQQSLHCWRSKHQAERRQRVACSSSRSRLDRPEAAIRIAGLAAGDRVCRGEAKTPALDKSCGVRPVSTNSRTKRMQCCRSSRKPLSCRL
jgi:hypothetical protein